MPIEEHCATVYNGSVKYRKEVTKKMKNALTAAAGIVGVVYFNVCAWGWLAGYDSILQML